MREVSVIDEPVRQYRAKPNNPDRLVRVPRFRFAEKLCNAQYPEGDQGEHERGADYTDPDPEIE